MRVLTAGLLTAGLILGIGLPLVSRRHAVPPPLATTADVQQLDRLWADLAKLQGAASEMDRDEYVRLAVARTAEFLRLDGMARDGFALVVDESLAHLRDARAALRSVHLDTAGSLEDPRSVEARRVAWSAWQVAQRAAADCLRPAFEETPRHALLENKRLRWLLRVDTGAREGA